MDDKTIKAETKENSWFRCPYCGKFGGVTFHTDFAGIPTYHCNECGNSWNGILPIHEPFRAKREKGNSWFHCPHCGKALFPIQENTKIQHMPFRCKACKHDIEVNV